MGRRCKRLADGLLAGCRAADREDGPRDEQDEERCKGTANQAQRLTGALLQLECDRIDRIRHQRVCKVASVG